MGRSTPFPLPPEAGAASAGAPADDPLGAVGAGGASDERSRADHVVESAFLTWRATGLLTGLAAVATGWRRQRSPVLAVVQLGGAAAESWWLRGRLRRGRLWSDPTGATVDAGAALVVLAASRCNLAREDRWTWINWAPWSFASNVIAGQAMGVDDVRRGATGAAAVTVVNALLDPLPGAMVATTTGMAAFFVIGRFFARQIRTGAARPEAAQAAAVAAGADLAAERERLAQLRLLHDGAVQTLEAIGGGRLTEVAAVRALAGGEARRLLAELAPGDRAGRALDAELARVAAGHRDAGLDVVVDVGDLAEPPAAAVDALGAAAGEALTNVRKHAATSSARLRAGAGRDGTGVVVTIEDDGTGFDPAARKRGFGLTESISRRLAEVGGTSSVRSSPGRGTCVTLEWPA